MVNNPPCDANSNADVVESLFGFIGIVLALVILIAVFALPWLSWYVSYEWQVFGGETPFVEQVQGFIEHLQKGE